MLNVSYVSGEASSDGEKVTLVLRADERQHEFVLARDDIQPFVNLLIALGGQASIRSKSARRAAALRPFPIDAVSLSEDDAGTVLILEVGATRLAFLMDDDQRDTLGHLLLSGSASSDMMPG